MALAGGERFGPYVISSEIGAGGMGVVYRATDTNLKRDVAVKVLPDSLASDDERLTRFQREAELLAALNHANIAQVYGLERIDGATALVMELVEGPTLEDRIKRGAIPPDEALGVAMQVAEALEGAHGQGIVHRDVKPANIKLRPDGVVKVLDFGIAKALAPDVLTTEPPSPMMTTPATQVGVILGTAAYMSPEQARGKRVDQRADIWAFGCVLYEMLTGQPVFAGDDVTVTLARVVEREPDFNALPASVSAAVRRTLELCLKKDIKDRLHSIADVRLALQGAFETAASQATAAPVWRRALPFAATAAGTALITGVIGWSFSPVPEPQPMTRLMISHPTMLGVGSSIGDVDIAISQDGQHLAYRTVPDSVARALYSRAIDQLEPTFLSDQARFPFFSPDAEWIGFVTNDNVLSRVARTGGPSLTIHENVDAPRGATWGPDDTIVYAVGEGSVGLVRISVAGGDEQLLTTPNIEIGERDHLFPQFLPGGRAVLFTITTDEGIDGSQIAVLDLETREYEVVISGGNSARYSASGHIVYSVSGTLRAVAFDVDSMEVRGTPVPVAYGVLTKPTGAADFGIADNGTLVYVPGGEQQDTPQRTVVWVGRDDGREEAIGADAAFYRAIRISPDGSRAVLDDRSEGNPLWVWDFTAGTRFRLNIGDLGGDAAVWSRDGTQIAYHPNSGNYIDWRSANGIGGPERLATAPENAGNVHAYFFTPTDELVFEGRTNADTGMDIGMMSANGGSTETAWLVQDPGEQRHADLSPDGRWMAYQSDDSGQPEIYVAPFPAVDNKVPVSNAGGIRPLWSRDGSELFYIEPGDPSRLIAVPVEITDEGPSFGRRTPILEWPYVTEGGGFRTYDVSPDGQRFLAIKGSDNERTAGQIVIVQNWFEELERLVPTE